MKQPITMLLFVFCLTASNHDSEHCGTLTSMESIIEKHPDSVPNVLQAFIPMSWLVMRNE